MAEVHRSVVTGLDRARWAAAAFCLVCGAGGASGQIRVVNYNVAQLSGDLASMQSVFAALNTDDKPGFAVAPAVYVFQEVVTGQQTTLGTMLNNARPPGVTWTYVLGTWNITGSEAGQAGFGGGAQAMFYRSDLVGEDATGYSSFGTLASRNTRRWLIRIRQTAGGPAYTSNDAAFYIYSSHLKAGTAASDYTDRNTGVSTIRSNAAALAGGRRIIFAGDYNLYSTGDAAYTTMVSAGSGINVPVDPLGNATWAGSGNAAKHTQSPYSGPNGLTGGGMNDRFDFQFMTAQLLSGQGLSLISGTYRPFGNDGQHYNVAINAGGFNNFYPGNPARGLALANSLALASDHLPLVTDLRVPAIQSASMPASFSRVIRGTPLSVPVSVSNAAPGAFAAGIDTLSFSIATSGGLSGSTAGTRAGLSAPFVWNAAVDTSAAGPVSGGVTVTSTNAGVENATVNLTTSGQVLLPSSPSFASSSAVTSLVLSPSFTAGTGVQSITVPVWNLGFTGNQALMNLDSITPPPASPFGLSSGVPASGIAGAASNIVLTFDTGNPPGPYTATYTVATSDEAVPGRTFGSLLLTVNVSLSGGCVLPGDADGNGSVGANDLSLVLASFGKCPGDANYDPRANLDGNPCIGANDLSIVLANFGRTCP
ncbi:MAG: hypothetical protein IBJ11_02145 [Phycisphaerales bacterium]|nr:hypothetical protein [Phycisphaerales bacterium]